MTATTNATWCFAASWCSSIRRSPKRGQTIGNLARLGIAIKVISGDNRHVTAHMAEAVGLDAVFDADRRGSGGA